MKTPTRAAWVPICPNRKGGPATEMNPRGSADCQCIMKERPILRGADGWRRLRSAPLCRAALRYGGGRVNGG
jgi:hypothetical protein